MGLRGCEHIKTITPTASDSAPSDKSWERVSVSAIGPMEEPPPGYRHSCLSPPLPPRPRARKSSSERRTGRSRNPHEDNGTMVAQKIQIHIFRTRDFEMTAFYQTVAPKNQCAPKSSLLEENSPEQRKTHIQYLHTHMLRDGHTRPSRPGSTVRRRSCT